MDPWRIGLLIASATFFVFLLLRLRPRMPATAEEEEGEEARSGAEQRVYNRVRKLPDAAQRRLLKRLEAALRTSEPGNDRADEPVD